MTSESPFIDSRELFFKTSRSPGPGGQHVNKASTQVTVCFDLWASPSLSQRQKVRIAGKLGSRITREGLLQTTARKHRSQSANRKEATQRLYDLIAQALKPTIPRKKTRKPAAANRRRLEQKRQRSRTKQRRQNPGREGD